MGNTFLSSGFPGGLGRRDRGRRQCARSLRALPAPTPVRKRPRIPPLAARTVPQTVANAGVAGRCRRV